MLTLTGEYALRAIVYLTQNAQRCPITGREVAEQHRAGGRTVAGPELGPTEDEEDERSDG